ncbi:MAG: flagellar hook-basal body complex protein [Paracoccaceae bacterium]
METAAYTSLSRQVGLARELQVVANNLANSVTTGYRQEGLVFSEFVHDSGSVGSDLSMTRAAARNTSLDQGTLTETEGRLDLAIEGEGFFQIETDRGPRLTRAGSFSSDVNGALLTPDGGRVMDDGGAPVFVPAGVDVHIASDGTISADGQPLGRIGLFLPVDRNDLHREDGVLFRTNSGVEPVDNPMIRQGFLEGSNVNAVLQIARLVEIQRAYEMGQSFLDAEDQRIRESVKTLIRST